MRLVNCAAYAAALLTCAAAQAAQPEYAAEVRQIYTARVQRVALAPISCPQQLDCRELEEEFIERLSELRFKVVEPRALRDLMTRAGVQDLEQLEQRLIIAEGLGVQGFAFVDIRNASIETSGPAADDKWREYKREVQVKHAAIDLRIIARDGAVLADVSGAAHASGMKGLQGVVERLFELMIERASHDAD